MTEDIQKTALRLPRDLHAKVVDAAAEAGRSMNAEIVYRLEKSFDDGSREQQVFFSRAAPEADDEPISEEEAETIIQSMVRAVRNMTKK